jgi:hypothetical protein
MEERSHYQERVLDKLYPPLGKKTNPQNELVRVCELYNDLFKDEKDEYLLLCFRKLIESNLSSVLKQDYRFYELAEYKEDHLLRVEDYIEGLYDVSSWDGVEVFKELAKDYLEECILEQEKILDKTIKFLIPIEGKESLDVLQFVSEEFLEEYKYSSKRKINFLNEELDQLNGFLKKDVLEPEKKERNRITVKNKKIFDLVKLLNLKVEFLREDFTSEDFLSALINPSSKPIHLIIDNRNFHYLLTQIRGYFFNFTISAVAKTNKIHSSRGTLMTAKNLLASKSFHPKHKDTIDQVIKKFA